MSNLHGLLIESLKHKQPKDLARHKANLLANPPTMIRSRSAPVDLELRKTALAGQVRRLYQKPNSTEKKATGEHLPIGKDLCWKIWTTQTLLFEQIVILIYGNLETKCDQAAEVLGACVAHCAPNPADFVMWCTCREWLTGRTADSG